MCLVVFIEPFVCILRILWFLGAATRTLLRSPSRRGICSILGGSWKYVQKILCEAWHAYGLLYLNFEPSIAELTFA